MAYWRKYWKADPGRDHCQSAPRCRDLSTEWDSGFPGMPGPCQQLTLT
jgi:hypothetical protein